MSEVTQPTVAYQTKIHSAHTMPVSSLKPDSKSSSSPSSLPSLQIPSTKKSPSPSSAGTAGTASTATTTSAANPSHPNVRTTTHISSSGATTSRSTLATPVCNNCETSTTPLWRRDESGKVLCNACGLFLKLHGHSRPISLKTDVIKSRNRVKNTQNSNKSDNNESRMKDKKHSPKAKDHDTHQQENHHQQQQQQQQQGSSFQQSQSQQQQKQGSFSNNRTSPALVPLLPRNNSNAATSTPSGALTPGFYPQFSSHLSHLQPHVPLHHPSTVPTQFATNLTTITSPLLLSTTPKSKIPHHQLSQTHAAAGVLETLSHSHKLPELAKDEFRLDECKGRIPAFSPHSALTGGIQFHQSPVTKLPSLMNPIKPNSNSSTYYSSPSFGPQHSITSKPSAFSLLSTAAAASSTSSSSSSEAKPATMEGSTSNTTSQTSQQHPPSPPSEQDRGTELIKLNNKVAELELVNDLYKSKIQELENGQDLYKSKIQELENGNDAQRSRTKELENMVESLSQQLAALQNKRSESPTIDEEMPISKRIKLDLANGNGNASV